MTTENQNDVPTNKYRLYFAMLAFSTIIATNLTFVLLCVHFMDKQNQFDDTNWSTYEIHESENSTTEDRFNRGN